MQMQDLSATVNSNRVGIAYFDSPIGRIDHDALRLIFEYTADAEYICYGRIVSESWIRLGHVCRVWRSVLFKMPRLWARDVLAFGTSSTLDDIVDRSQTLPLNLNAIYYPFYTLSLQRISPLISRAAVLRCNFKTFEEQQAILDGLIAYPPMGLHTLSLGVDPSVHPFKYPPSMYAACIEHLPIRHLELHEIYLQPPLLGTLISLTMTSDELLLTDRRLTVEEIANVLAHNIALEVLSLTDAISVFRNLDIVVPQPILLPALKFLNIHQNGNLSSFALLNFLRFPNPVMQRFLVYDIAIDTAPDLSAALNSALSACVRSPSLDSASFLRVECEARWSGKVLVEVGQPYLSLGVPIEHIPFHVEFDTRIWDATCLELSSAILDHLVHAQVPEQVTELSWNALEEDAQVVTYWETILEPFEAVETLLLLDVHQEREASLTAMFTALHPAHSDKPPLLPRLHRVVMRAWETDGMVLLRDLPTLQKRLEMGVPIREIRFSDIGNPDTKHIEDNEEVEQSVREQMVNLETQLGIGIESRECWEDMDGKRCFAGTEFVLLY